MKLYKVAKFSCKKPYYSLISSICMFFVSIYLKNILAIIVSVFSVLHHCRTYEDDDNDIFRYIDIFFALLLGFSFALHPENFVYLCLIIFIYSFIQIVKSSHLKSIMHMILHFVVIYLLFNEKNL